jgi:uncharacterized protein YmfQ (DUF2313 family)
MKSFFSKLTQAQAMLLVGAITVVFGGILTGYFQIRQTQIPIEATQTAAVEQSLLTQTSNAAMALATISQEEQGYELFFDGKRVGHQTNWSCQQALENLSWNIKQYSDKKVEGMFDNKKISFAGVGYELFFDCERVGYEPNWSSQQALENLSWNIRQYPNKEIEGLFNGEQLIP